MNRVGEAPEMMPGIRRTRSKLGECAASEDERKLDQKLTAMKKNFIR